MRLGHSQHQTDTLASMLKQRTALYGQAFTVRPMSCWMHSVFASTLELMHPITSRDENDFVYSIIKDNDKLWMSESFGGWGPWIGASRSGNGWSWVTGESPSPDSLGLWAPGEPNSPDEHYVSFIGTGQLKGSAWDDVPDSTKLNGFVVEFDGLHDEVVPVVIDFEDQTTTGPGEGGPFTVSHQYEGEGKGITFNEAKILDYSKGISPSRYQGFAHSGTKGIEQCYGREFCTKPIQMKFTAPQKDVGVWVGYSDSLSNQKMVIMRALDSSGALVKETTAVFQPSPSPIPIQTPMEIKSDNANIDSVTLNLASDANGPPDITNHLAVDDVEFDTPGHPPGCDATENPTVTITQPTSGQILGSNFFDVKGTVSTTSPLYDAKLIITGSGGSRSLDILSANEISHNGGAFSVNGITDNLFAGLNTITVRAQNCMGSGENSVTLTYRLCDNTISPVVIIAEPSPSDIVLSQAPELKGKINSPSSIKKVTATVTGVIWTAGGPTTTEPHQIDISLDAQGNFDYQLQNSDMFSGENTITVAAQNSEGCPGQASTTVVFYKNVIRRISGESYIQFAKENPQDKYETKDGGWLLVSHNPGCGVRGDNGDDTFFADIHSSTLRFGCTLEGIEFKQFWPTERKPDDAGCSFWGGGSYLTRVGRNGLKVTVHWENACCGRYDNKDIKYMISFLIGVPENLENTEALGEPMFDPHQVPMSELLPPNGFSSNEQNPHTSPQTPQVYKMPLQWQASSAGGNQWVQGSSPPIPNGKLKKVRNINSNGFYTYDLWFPNKPGSGPENFPDTNKGYMLKVNSEATPSQLGLSEDLNSGLILIAVPTTPNLASLPRPLPPPYVEITYVTQ
jgi:hypothetical protein